VTLYHGSRTSTWREEHDLPALPPEDTEGGSGTPNGNSVGSGPAPEAGSPAAGSELRRSSFGIDMQRWPETSVYPNNGEAVHLPIGRPMTQGLDSLVPSEDLTYTGISMDLVPHPTSPGVKVLQFITANGHVAYQPCCWANEARDLFDALRPLEPHRDTNFLEARNWSCFVQRYECIPRPLRWVMAMMFDLSCKTLRASGRNIQLREAARNWLKYLYALAARMIQELDYQIEVPVPNWDSDSRYGGYANGNAERHPGGPQYARESVAIARSALRQDEQPAHPYADPEQFVFVDIAPSPEPEVFNLEMPPDEQWAMVNPLLPVNSHSAAHQPPPMSLAEWELYLTHHLPPPNSGPEPLEVDGRHVFGTYRLTPRAEEVQSTRLGSSQGLNPRARAFIPSAVSHSHMGNHVDGLRRLGLNSAGNDRRNVPSPVASDAAQTPVAASIFDTRSTASVDRSHVRAFRPMSMVELPAEELEEQSHSRDSLGSDDELIEHSRRSRLSKIEFITDEGCSGKNALLVDLQRMRFRLMRHQGRRAHHPSRRFHSHTR
jgi:hypothetical protein